MSKSRNSRSRQALLPGLALLALAVLAAVGGARAAEGPSVPPAPAAPAAGASPLQRFESEGVAVELAIDPLAPEPAPAALREGGEARVRLTFTDFHTGQPLSGLFPGAWLDRLPGGTAETSADACRKKVQGFVGGSLLHPPEQDLNAYFVVALNEDATLSVVDPLFGFGGSKLLAMVFLDAPGEDWALSADGRWLYVSLPGPGAVAVVDTETWKVAAKVPVAPGAGRLALQPDGHYLWVAYGGKEGEGVAAIDTARRERVAAIPTGRGPHDLAASDDDRLLFVTNRDAGTVSVVDVRRLAKLAELATGERPVSVDWSAAARAAFVAHEGDGAIAVVGDPGGDAPAVLARIAAEPGLAQIRFAPGGRLAFAANPRADRVHVVDAARRRIIQTAEVEAGPDQVSFTSGLAYVRHRGSDTVLMIPLAEVGQEGKPVPVVDFPGGQNPPGQVPLPTPAAGIVPAPGAAAVLVANPLDRTIYYYKEGMAAPMGSFQNYSRQPRAVLAVDRSLRPAAPGVYETTVPLGPAGRLELALFLDTPRIVHCFPFAIAADPARPRRRAALDVRPIVESTVVRVGEETRLRFRLSDPASGEPRRGLTDVRALTFLSPGLRQQRHPATEVGDGLYEVRFAPPESGIYFVFLESGSAGLPLQKSPAVTLDAQDAPAPVASGGT